MASVSQLTLVNGAFTATETGSSTALEPFSNSFIGYLHISANDGATTIDAKIQHSADNSNWIDLVAFTQVVNTTAFEAKQITNSVLPYIRGLATFTAGNSATIKIGFYFDKLK